MFTPSGSGYTHRMSSRETPVTVVDRLERPVCDDAWNIEHRAEMPLQRADRNLAELLQELRVAQTGVQILFAFLLTLSFMDRFALITAFQRGVYVFTLVTSAMTVALLVAPVAVHRLLFQRGRKRELVHVGHRMAVTGLVSLAITMLAGMLLVLDVVVGRAAAVATVAALAVVFAALWAGVPLRVRRGPVLRLRPRRGQGEADELDAPVVDTVGCRCSSGRPAQSTPAPQEPDAARASQTSSP
jgi:hypothetical protein